MKSVLLLGAVLSISAVQIPRALPPFGPNPQPAPTQETPIIWVMDSATVDSDGVLHANKATCAFGTVHVTADDVDVNRTTSEYVLRGDVRAS